MSESKKMKLSAELVQTLREHFNACRENPTFDDRPGYRYDGPLPESGDIFDFVATIQGIDRETAIRRVAAIANGEEPEELPTR
jgi:hypothetical protein